VKGKPWTVKEEKLLREMLQAGKSIKVIAGALGKTQNAIRQKMINLDLKEEKNVEKNDFFSSSNLKLPDDLPSVEDQLKVLAGALEALKTARNRVDVMRLRGIIHGVKVYKELFADYVSYRALELKVEELIRELEGDGEGSSGVARKGS